VSETPQETRYMNRYPFKQSVLPVTASGLVFSMRPGCHQDSADNTNGMLVGTIKSKEDEANALKEWNRIMYSGFPLLTSARGELANTINSMLGIGDKKNYLNYREWPQQLNQKQYDELFALTEEMFIEILPVEKQHIGKHAIQHNQKFWERERLGIAFFAEICYLPEEPITFGDVFFEHLEDAITGGVLLLEYATSFQTNPEILYYYREFLVRDLKEQGVDTNNFWEKTRAFDNVYANARNYYALDPAAMKSFTEKHADVISLLKNAMESLPEKPFNIIKI